ncbi:MAG TPA: hypothetical protein VJ826_12460 [Candidatus Polarisedimenticolaceae bacterium]|nr:hypothetical protein [Candidatus Polarisedimenticolaceae bacterium]
MARNRLGLGVFALMCVFSYAPMSKAQTADHNVVYVCDPPSSCQGDGTFGNPWRTTNQTGGISEALAQCTSLPPLSNQVGCTIVLPKGYVKIERTIDTSCPLAAACASGQFIQRYGLVIQGHGSGTGYADSTGAHSGTTLVWAGPDNGSVVLKINDTANSTFENFIVVGHLNGFGGTGKADVGIQIVATKDLQAQPPLVGAADKNTLRNIVVDNVDLVGVRIGADDPTRTYSGFIDSIVIDQIATRRMRVGGEQNGQQTTNVHWQNCAFEDFSDAGLDLFAPDIHVLNSSFISSIAPIDAAKRADVRVHSLLTSGNGTDWRGLFALFEGNVHETYRGPAYLFCNGTTCGAPAETGATRVEPTTFVNTRVLYHNEGGARGPSENKVIDYQHGGPLNLIGCTFDLHSNAATNSPTVNVNIPNVTYPTDVSTIVTSTGNYYVKKQEGGQVTVAFTGDAILVADDDPFHVAPMTNAKVANVYKDAGLVFDEGSFNWKKAAESGPRFSEYLESSSQLTLLGSTSLPTLAPIASWTTSGELKLRSATPKLSFQNTSLVAASPGTAATITVPSSTGTVLLDTNPNVVMTTGGQTLSSKDLSNGTNTFPALGLVSFSAAAPGTNATTFLAPGSLSGATSAVQALVPTMTVKTLRCRSSATGLSGSKKLDVWIQKSGSPQGSSCALNSASATCSITLSPAVSFNGTSDTLDLKVTTTGNPGGNVMCTASVGF